MKACRTDTADAFELFVANMPGVDLLWARYENFLLREARRRRIEPQFGVTDAA